MLVHHPYDSFRTSVEAFLTQAATDPDVLAIKHTLYRTSGRDNPIVRALIRAAQTGKEVVALIELKARFDEGSNIEWARRLEQAGVHVVYGIVGLKTHAKIALVVRREGSQIRRYCHIGTGNYNPTTADTYEDVGLLSARPELGADISEVFNYLTGCGRPQRLPAAAGRARDAALAAARRDPPRGGVGRRPDRDQGEQPLRRRESSRRSTTASRAGTEIDLIVRSICCLRPGVPGLSERIRVRSTLGRFLEHSRVFRFGQPERDAALLHRLGRPDDRNLDQRVETLVQIDDPRAAGAPRGDPGREPRAEPAGLVARPRRRVAPHGVGAASDLARALPAARATARNRPKISLSRCSA